MGGYFREGPMAGMPADEQGLAAADDAGLIDLQGLAGGLPEEQAPVDLEGLSEAELFDLMLSAALRLAAGEMSEQNKAVVQDIMSDLQRIKASEEKEDEQAMAGKFSPGAMRRALGS